MENNEIMNRLLQEDKPASAIQDDISTAKRNGEDSVSEIRLVSAKNKLYAVIAAIIIFLLLLIWIPNIKSELTTTKNTYNQVSSRLTVLEGDIRTAEDDMNYLCSETYGIVKYEDKLKSCLNEDKCSDLPAQWKVGSGEEVTYNFTIPLSYLQAHSLYNKKMPVDEKKVLKNLNEYLIKQDISGGDRNRVGEILRIDIGDPESVQNGDEHFFQVPVDVQIEFPTVDDLIEFLYNVEKKMIDDPDDRILYKIQSVSYDIVTNDEPQITDISMIAYYYHDAKFDSKTVTINATVKGESIYLEKDKGDDVVLKKQIAKTKEIKAEDLVEISGSEKAEFKGRGIDITQEGKPQKVTINILAQSECTESSNTVNTNEKVVEEGDDSDSFFDELFKSFKN